MKEPGTPQIPAFPKEYEAPLPGNEDDESECGVDGGGEICGRPGTLEREPPAVHLACLELELSTSAKNVGSFSLCEMGWATSTQRIH